ncbi:hypothetical protein ES705_14359 [subsurface metagenome]
MSLESPITYAEWYWKHSVDAESRSAELLEQEISPLVKMLLGDILALEDLPDGVRNVLQILAEPVGEKLGGFGSNLLGEVLGNALGTILEQPLKKSRYSMGKIFSGERIDAATTAVLNQRIKITPEKLEERYKGWGYTEGEWDYYYAASQPYPSIPDIMLWARYFAPTGDAKTAFKVKYDIPDNDYDLWEWQTLQRLNTMQAQSLLKRGEFTKVEFNRELEKIGWSVKDQPRIEDLGYILPNSMLMVQGGLIQELDEKIILENISKGDIHSEWAQTYLDAVLTKPASIDIMAYELRQENKLANLPKELKKIGIHPDYTDVYKTLAYQIPPVADIITMAVREAFTPAIAAKFGQYEDFPDDLEKYAGQKGLDAEWAKRYWAAHWALPSPQQGFEMLHRGVIDPTELNMLLRAQDVMPFWRDRLTAIAYRPLTRVDVRRMYKQGVLNEREVFESYQDQGYDDENAERMAEFTVRQTLASLSKFTSSDIIKAFSNRMISRSDAISMLRDIDIRPEDANYIVSTAEYKRLWAFTDDQIAGIRNLYKKRMYDENQTRDKLARLNLPSDQINVLMEQWYYEKVDELDATWSTAQTLKFLRRKLITPDRAKRELYLNGYSQERIDIYFKDLQWTPPKE